MGYLLSKTTYLYAKMYIIKMAFEVRCGGLEVHAGVV